MTRPVVSQPNSYLGFDPCPPGGDMIALTNDVPVTKEELDINETEALV